MARVLVAICTHNPEPAKFKKVLNSIAHQSLQDFRLIVVDNASARFPKELLVNLNHEYYFENRLGNAYARFTALSKWNGEELFIFVDDDNILDSNYFEVAIRSMHDHPDWGVFGGQQYPSRTLRTSKITKELLPYVGIRSLGFDVLETNATLHWNELEPIGAGMCLSGAIVKYFLNMQLDEEKKYYSLGRKGRSLLSGEDSYIARFAAKLSLKYGYNPELKLEHLIWQKRLKLWYLFRLLYAYGKSDVILDSALGIQPTYPYPRSFVQALQYYSWQLLKSRAGFIIGIRQWGIYSESKNIKNDVLK